MHPAYSVILFTTASGAGYGLLALLGLGGAAGALPASPWFTALAFVTALALVTGGLLASTFHLGHPERAWRALTQWRTSWLAREGVAAVATYIPAMLFALDRIFFSGTGAASVALGLGTAALAALTVLCTGMIYASLRTIPRWNTPWVVPLYLAFALATGAVLLATLARLFGFALVWVDTLAVLAPVFAWGLRLMYWREADAAPPRATAESATGLGHLGRVRELEPAATSKTYVQREMGFAVARKHATKLRRIALATGLGAALLALTGAFLAGGYGLLGFLPATALLGVSVAIERWLFFAEAVHVVTLYHGGSAV